MVLWARVSRVFGRARLVALAVCAVATALVVAAPLRALGQAPDPSPVASPSPAIATVTETPGVSQTPVIYTPEPVGTGGILPVRGTLTPPPMQDEPLVVPTPTETATLPPTSTSLPAVTPTPFPTLNLTPVISTEPTPTPRPFPSPVATFPPLPTPEPRARGKVSPRLYEWAAAAQAGTLTPTEYRFYNIQDGLVAVTIRTDAAGAAATIAAVESLGGRIESRNDIHGAVFLGSRVPLARLVDLESISSVHAVFSSPGLLQHSPPNYAPAEAPTQALADMNWYAWNLGGDGYTGRNVRIGIVDFGGFGGWDAAAAAGELPPWPGISCDYGSISSFHGTSVAEIIHDVAPDAELVLARVGIVDSVPSAIRCLRQRGVHIISASLGFGYRVNEGPGDGTGAVNSSITDVVNNYGVFFSQSSGNSALGYWRGVANDNDQNGWLNFGGGPIEVITIPNVPPGRSIEINLRWSDDWSRACRDYDLFVYDASWVIIDKEENIQGCDLIFGTSPVESVQFTSRTNAQQNYYIAI